MTHIYTHPGQPQMQVEVILASFSHNCPPIYTIRMRYPRIIHGEIMTHRMFSRNARSSRAVPVSKMLDEIRNTPFVPWHWGKNQKGMQASEECDEMVVIPADEDSPNSELTFTREWAWLHARDTAVNTAEAFMEAGYHKQNVNRLLEPFSWIDTLVTSTNWSNFLWLRDHKDAEPHLQDLARLVDQAIKRTQPRKLTQDEWHLPYITVTDLDHVLFNHGIEGEFILRKISAARCARISYAPFDGDASYERELERYDSLVSSDRIHASPLEHQAKPDTKASQNMTSFSRVLRNGEYHYKPNTHVKAGEWCQPELHGNLTGWIQFRKLIPGEASNQPKT